MVTPAVGSVVLVPFPFSDLSASKLRPAVILAEAGHSDWVCAQITSNPFSDPKAIQLLETDFTAGSLDRISYARPSKLFTADELVFRRAVADVKDQKFASIIDAVICVLRGQ